MLVKVNEQLSVAVGGIQDTAVPQVIKIISEGQPAITGVLISTTVTLNEHVPMLPFASVAV